MVQRPRQLSTRITPGRGRKVAKERGLEADFQDGMGDYEDQEEMSARLNTPGQSDDEIEDEERYEKKDEQEQQAEEGEEYVEPWACSPLSEATKFKVARVDNWHDYNKPKTNGKKTCVHAK